MGWLGRHAATLQAIAMIFLALIAGAALVGIKLQVGACDLLAREQSARDIHRAHLALSVAHPDFADPDICAINDNDAIGAYAAHVEHAIRTAERMVDLNPELISAASDLIAPHAVYLCTFGSLEGHASETITMLRQIRAAACEPMTATCLE